MIVIWGYYRETSVNEKYQLSKILYNFSKKLKNLLTFSLRLPDFQQNI